MSGKISRLPKAIREQLNRRLDDDEPQVRLLAWLNSLPEVQALLAAEFNRQPVSPQNLYQWTQHGFRDWKMRQNALAFATTADADPLAPGPASTPGLTDKLVHWLALRFAATAYTLAPVDDEPETELRRLRNLTADIVALRRGDLFSRRIALEEKRLALLVAESDQQREDEFWEWTERPEIRKELQEQLAKELQEKRAWHKTLRAMVPEISPYLPKESSDRPDLPPESDSPAALI